MSCLHFADIAASRPKALPAALRRSRLTSDTTPNFLQESPNPYNNPEMLLKPAEIKSWVAKVVTKLASNGLDGVALDIEVGFTDAPHRDGLTQAVCELKRQMSETIPGSLLVFVSYFYVEGNSYDYAGIAKCADLLQPMTYCMQNDYKDYGKPRTTATACNPLPILRGAMEKFSSIDVPPNKLAPLLPWFGLRYHCATNKLNERAHR